MTPAAKRALALALLLFVQLSLGSLLFPGALALHFLTAAALALSFSRGFQRAFLPLLVLGLAYDALSFGRPGWPSAVLLVAAYAGSFVSKRFLAGHGLSRLLVVALFGGGAAFVEYFLSAGAAALWSGGFSLADWLTSLPGWRDSLLLFVANAFLAVLLFLVWSRLEERWEASAPLRLSR